MALGPIATVPSSTAFATTDKVPVGLDCTNAIANIAGGSVSSPTVTLTDAETGANISSSGLSGTPSVTGNVVTQVVVGSAMTVGRTYLLKCVFTAAANTILTVVLQINCTI